MAKKKRLLFNLQHEQQTVLLIDADPARASILKRALRDYHYQIVAIINNAKTLLDHVNEYQPQLVVVGIDLPDEETLEQLGVLNKEIPRPVVMFAEKDTPKIIQKAIKAGVSAFIVDDIQPQRLPTIISIAMARFEEQQSLKNELESAKNKLAERKLIEKAKGLLMKQRLIAEDEAFAVLRKMAMDKGKSLSVVSENIIDVLELIKT